MTSLTSAKYVFDSGPFIQMKEYPPDIFTGLWVKFDQLIGRGEIISCSEVYKEIAEYDDQIGKWAQGNKGLFLKPDINEQKIAREVLQKFPNLVNQNKAVLTGKPIADPFVIAQAKTRNCHLVSTEKSKPNAHKIPNVCHDFGIPHLNLFDFFRSEGWTF